MNEENCKADEHNGIGLMDQCNDDIDVGQDGKHAECDLERHHTNQPFEPVLDIGGVILFFYDDTLLYNDFDRFAETAPYDELKSWRVDFSGGR